MVRLAAGLLILLGITFVVVPIVALRFGGAAQTAAEAETVAQGGSAETLSRHGIRFRESAVESLLPFGIAAVLFCLAGLVLAGVPAGRVATWIVAGILIVVGGFITWGQLMATSWTAAAFAKSDDATVQQLDATAIVRAAADEFPIWLRPIQFVRFLLTTVGLIVVIVALTTSAAADHFR